MIAAASMYSNCPNRFHRAAAVAFLLLLVAHAAVAQEAAVSMDAVIDDRQPRSTFVPEYPQKALEQRREGSVTVCFLISAAGTVERAKIRKSSHRIFEKPVLRAMRASTFEPLESDETASPKKTCRTFHFRLQHLKEKPAAG